MHIVIFLFDIYFFTLNPGETKWLLFFVSYRGLDQHEVDQMGYTALHVACETGRTHNVRLLLERSKRNSGRCQM